MNYIITCLIKIFIKYVYTYIYINFEHIVIGNRIEDFFYEKIDKKKPNRLSNLEYVGTDMIEAGNDFGPGVAYG